MILDLSFHFFFNGSYKSSVNDTTVPQAPVQSMGQLGTCFRRLIATMAANYSPEQPFRFSKLDVKDGFWRMVVSTTNVWNFCYVLLTEKNLKTLNLLYRVNHLLSSVRHWKLRETLFKYCWTTKSSYQNTSTKTRRHQYC